MTRTPTPDEIADHERDHLKNYEARPPGINATEIALIVKGLKNIDECAKLIDQYADMVAAGAKLEGVDQATHRVLAVLDRKREVV